MTRTSRIRPKYVPSVSDYKKAFQQIEITEKQKDLLIHHCLMPSHITTAQELADFVGYKSYRGVNLQYGKLGMMLVDAIDKDFGNSGVLMLFTCVRPNGATNENWLLVLRTNVVLALEELDWGVEKTSDLF